MSTTTIRMPEDLKERIREAASRTGTSTHAFILQAIEEKAEQEALRHDFDDIANQRYARILESGETIAWSDMRCYLQDRAQGKNIARPIARKLAP